ncbi:MAG: S26 family signal peptidase, partial [Planctomycetes bacterium]|nr:S26 family signal peptidase [Planctomycetota bacterium]
WRDREGNLIADFYAYNTGELDYGGLYAPPVFRSSQATGAHWVGDIGLAAEVTVKSEEGELLLDLVEAGVHYTARIDVETGEAVLVIGDGGGQFLGEDGGKAGKEIRSKGATEVRGPGSYELRFANADNELTLWVDGDVVEFAGPTTYQPTGETQPHWTPEDPLDLAPAGLGVNGAAIEAESLRILRDVYYLALEGTGQPGYDYNLALSDEEIQAVLTDPSQWDTTSLFENRREVTFELTKDQFFPLGDNSPQSKDARIWEPEPHVDRKLLTGKALFIYWPHHWRRPVPFLPNFARMGFIR